MTTAAAVPGWSRLVPAAGWLRSYDRSTLVRDAVGGVAAGSVVIPQAMAYATIADLPAQVATQGEASDVGPAG
jgi:MFS superfamily sulfate permease-like transporter